MESCLYGSFVRIICTDYLYGLFVQIIHGILIAERIPEEI